MKCLIVKPSSLGDILHAFPAVSALARREPSATIDWVAHPAFADLPKGLPFVRRVILFDRKRLGRASSFLPALWSLLKDLREERYDVVLDMQGLLRSAAVGALARGPLPFGPAHPRESCARLFYRRGLSDGGAIHAVDVNNAMMSDFLGTKDLDFSFVLPRNPAFAGEAAELLALAPKSPTPPIAVAPGARWATKQWPPEFFARVMDEIAEQRPDAAFVALGTKDEAPLAARISSLVRKARVADLCGRTTLGGLVETIRGCSLLLCNDSGPMHVAAALKKPVVAVFGPTDPEKTGPYCEKKSILVPDSACIRCFKRYCVESACHSAVDPRAAALAVCELLDDNLGRPKQ